MQFKVGEMIRVRASNSLGTPPTKATIIRLDYPLGHPRYPQGLATVRENYAPFDEFQVDALGYVYSGPPLAGSLVRFK